MNIQTQAGRCTPFGQLVSYPYTTAREPKPVSHARTLINMSAVRGTKPFTHADVNRQDRDNPLRIKLPNDQLHSETLYTTPQQEAIRPLVEILARDARTRG